MTGIGEMRGYFDGNATTPLWDEALSAWERTARECWGNASALYSIGAKSKVELARVREAIAGKKGVDPRAIVFTAGATEGNNAILMDWFGRGERGVISLAEHPSVSWALNWNGGKVETWPLKNNGQISLNWLRKRLQQGTAPDWIALQSVNNETGVIQPLEEVLALLKGTSVKVLCDATQHWGKLPSLKAHPQVWEVVSAHKFGGPKGVGWITLGDCEQGIQLQRGGGQENGFRGGTENLAAIVAMEAALNRVEEWREKHQPDGKKRDWFERSLKEQIPGVQIAGEEAPRVWNTSLLIMPRHENHRWVTRMNRKGFALATGAACSTGKIGGSIGLRAMGFSREERKCAVRVSAGWWTTDEDWENLLGALVETWRELEEESSAANVIVLPQ